MTHKLNRVDLIPARGLASSYVKDNKRIDIGSFNNRGQRGNFICQDMFDALKELVIKVAENKGRFYLTDLFRTWNTQASNRTKFETGAKGSYVARPGRSFHNAGRAVDFDVKNLNFEGRSQTDWLKVLWEICIPLGFYPIIKIPDIHASESWHLDYPGKDWVDAYNNLDYSEVAKCVVLDVGEWNPSESYEKIRSRFIQSQLIRLGYFEIGKVDGIIGPKTDNALNSLGLLNNSVDYIAAFLTKLQK